MLSSRINHTWRRATICFAGRNKPVLASARATCETWSNKRLGQNKITKQGEDDAGSYPELCGPDGARRRIGGRDLGARAEEIRSGRQRYRDQDRQHHAL